LDKFSNTDRAASRVVKRELCALAIEDACGRERHSAAEYATRYVFKVTPPGA